MQQTKTAPVVYLPVFFLQTEPPKISRALPLENLDLRAKFAWVYKNYESYEKQGTTFCHQTLKGFFATFIICGKT